MSGVLFGIGALIAVGAAGAFVAFGVLSVYGAARATVEHLLPGFRPDRPSPATRVLTILAVWLPVAVVGFFGVYAGVWIIQRVIAALQ
jgi:hypothetical protein